MRRILLICERPYALYKAMVRSVHHEDCSYDIVISNHSLGMEQIKESLIESRLFENVYYFDDKGYQTYVSGETLSDYISFPKIIWAWPKKLAKYFKYHSDSRNIVIPEGLDFSVYDEIIANDGVSALNFYLFDKKIMHVVSEHARNNFKIKVKLHILAVRITMMLDALGILPAYSGMSKYVNMIEVSDNNDLVNYIKKKTIRVFNVDDCISQLSITEKQKIYETYAKAYNLPLFFDRKADLILTAALARDGLVKSENDQLICHKSIIDQYTDSDLHYVIIKPHPKDTLDYKQINEDLIVVDPAISAEILGLCETLHYGNVITIFSTAILSFKDAENCVVLGPEYLHPFNATMKDNQFNSLKTTADEVRRMLRGG